MLRAVLTGVACLALVCTTAVTPAQASNVVEFSHTVNPGSLATDIRDENRNPVANPGVTMSTSVAAFECLAGGNASTGTLGSNTQRVYVDNPGAANDGWTLAVAATGGATSTWENAGATEQYDFNDPSGSTAGCADGGDADSVAGQLTIDPSTSTLFTDCGSCTTTGLSLGSAAAFSQGTTDNVTLLSAAASSADNGRWYFTGASASQTVPEGQAADSYTLDLTLTVTAA